MQKIIPSLWFDTNCEEAINFYISVFSKAPHKSGDSKIISIKRYEKGMETPRIEKMVGKVLTAVFELEGYRFMALDGGPVFKLNPSISFHVKCGTRDEVDAIWEKLSQGGKVLMELDKYPFSERYGWVQDRYGLSWQVIHSEQPFTQKFTPIMMFTGKLAGRAEEAVNSYVSIFKNSKINMISRYGKGMEPDKENSVNYAGFMLEGMDFGTMDSAREHDFSFSEAISFLVNCQDQEEVDRLWERLSAHPQFEQCGWLKDKYGVSWQIIPERMGQLLSDPDKEKAQRVLNAMLQMKKIVIADLEKAYEGGD